MTISPSGDNTGATDLAAINSAISGSGYAELDAANQRIYVCTTDGGSPVWSGIA